MTLDEIMLEHPHDAYAFVVRMSVTGVQLGDKEGAERFAMIGLELLTVRRWVDCRDNKPSRSCLRPKDHE